MSALVASPVEVGAFPFKRLDIVALAYNQLTDFLLSSVLVTGDNKDSSSGPGNRQHFGPVGVVGKKKGARASAAAQAGPAPEDKDPDGSFRIPGYRGVWVNPKGKHFVKVSNTILKDPGSEDPLFFDNIEEAAKKHDAALKEQGNDPKAELNYQEDGTRIVYEDVATSSTSGLGGSASNVVPALSVINIKVDLLSLPKREPARWRYSPLLLPMIIRICQQMLSHCLEIPDKPQERGGIPSVMSMRIEGFADKLVRGTTAGRARFPSWA